SRIRTRLAEALAHCLAEDRADTLKEGTRVGFPLRLRFVRSRLPHPGLELILRGPSRLAAHPQTRGVAREELKAAHGLMERGVVRLPRCGILRAENDQGDHLTMRNERQRLAGLPWIARAREDPHRRVRPRLRGDRVCLLDHELRAVGAGVLEH